MKTLIALLFSASLSTGLYAQKSDSTGLPGDNLDLHAVLELFKKAPDMESFEKSLNSEDNKVNNLDLNGDKKIDYIRVVDHKDSTVHAIVLQVNVTEKESQDVAVIELEKTGKETAQVQITGDEELYGKEYFIEPKDAKDDKAPEASARIIVVNVWFWPCVRYVYAPVYRGWHSPWRWGYYPMWWRPWTPVYWHVYHPRVVHYHSYYHVVHVRRSPRAHVVYHPHRSTSVVVHKKYAGNSKSGKSTKVVKTEKNNSVKTKSEKTTGTKNKSDKTVKTEKSNTRTEKSTGGKQTGNKSTRKSGGGGKTKSGGGRK